jgi:hypothetical protein
MSEEKAGKKKPSNKMSAKQRNGLVSEPSDAGNENR